MAGLGETLGSGAMTNDYESIKHADTIMVIGSNTTEAHPVIGAMIKERVRAGAKLIVCDPRLIELHRYADASVRQRSGSDVALVNAMMHVILKEGLHDEAFVRERVEGFEALKALVQRYTPEYAEEITGVPAETIVRAARLYGGAKNAAIFYTMGITQHVTGTNNVRSLCSLALLCGNLGRPGTGVNPLRGQNNVQGACDMGCLPATLPGYLKVNTGASAEKTRALWGCAPPEKAGLTVAAMMEAAAKGDIGALFIMGENPAVTDADTGHAVHTLGNLDFLAVQDIFLTETARLADVVLPAACWPEKEGTCTNTTRAVQLLRKACDPPGGARDDWRTFVELAKRFGHQWRFDSAKDIFEEIRKANPAYAGMNYERLERGYLQWPCPDENHPGTPVLHKEKFARAGGKAIFSPCEWSAPHEWPDGEYPFIATTGRSLFHYHSGSMTRRGAPGRHLKELYIEINPADAKNLALAEGETLTVTSRRGSVSGRARITEKVAPGMVFLPFHFAEAPANLLTAAVWDPTSETPGFKVSAVRLSKG